MSAAREARWCGLESDYGTCHRAKGHQGVHATGIGRGFWFAWVDHEEVLGYGHFSHGRFVSGVR